MRYAAALCVAVFILSANCQAIAAEASQSPSMKPLPVGQVFPDITLHGPASEREAKALGVAASAKSVRLKELKAEAVVLVVFSMYCPYCQKEGPQLTAMDQLIKKKGLDSKLKLIGLGAGNSAFEVNVYREKFAIPFPLFPDQDFAAYKTLGQVGTPYYYVLKRKGADFEIMDGQLGCMASPEAFLDGILAKTGLTKGK